MFEESRTEPLTSRVVAALDMLAADVGVLCWRLDVHKGRDQSRRKPSHDDRRGGALEILANG